MKDKYSDVSERFCDLIYKSNLSGLPISDYNKRYLNSLLLPSLRYYANIYSRCFSVLKDASARGDMVCVDYGGGCGLLSIYAKLMGVGTVIYIDLNPVSVSAAGKIFEKVGFGADVLLEGDVPALQEWCQSNNMVPTHLVSTDVIEHIYDLNDYFGILHEINPNMSMAFSTASVADNPVKSHRLRKAMIEWEGKYLVQRLAYIKEKFPTLDEQQSMIFAKKTRGLRHEDIDAVVLGFRTAPDIDKYNTCNPETGFWIERILTTDQYEEIVKPFDYKIKFYNGFYNEAIKSSKMRRINVWLNRIIEKNERIGRMLSPFIILQLSGESAD